MFQTPRGTKDTPPEEMIRYEYVISVIKKIYEKYGFDPLDTPAFEEWEALSAKKGGGDAIKEEIYYFKDKSDRELGLRFDLTVPLGRFVASNPDIPKPFKRYQIGKVWRYDKPGALRWREFMQADIDIIGSESMEAEAECLMAICDVFKELGFSDFKIRLNNRKIIQDFIKSFGIENYADVFRSIDKLEKIGKGEVTKELLSKGLMKSQIESILSFVGIKDLEQVKKYLSSDGISELEQILSICKEYPGRIQVDMSLIRGLDYYTGPVFEISLGAGVSVGGGGRYENLIEAFGGKKTPATGISIGVSRLVAVMSERGMFTLPKTLCKLFIVSVNESVKDSVISLAQQLRSLGIACEFDIMSRSLSKQLSYINSRGIPFSLVIGEKELKEGKAKLRNMKTGNEIEVELSPMAIKNIL